MSVYNIRYIKLKFFLKRLDWTGDNFRSDAMTVQTGELSALISWQAISSTQRFYPAHRTILKNVARLHRASF